MSASGSTRRTDLGPLLLDVHFEYRRHHFRLRADCAELAPVVPDADPPDVRLDLFGPDQVAVVDLQVGILAVLGSVVLASAGVAGDVEDGEVGVDRDSVFEDREVLFADAVDALDQVVPFEADCADVVFSLDTGEPVAAGEERELAEGFGSLELLEVGVAFFEEDDDTATLDEVETGVLVVVCFLCERRVRR